MEKGSSNGMVRGPLFWDVVGFLVKLRHLSSILVLFFCCYHGIFSYPHNVFPRFHTDVMGVSPGDGSLTCNIQTKTTWQLMSHVINTTISPLVYPLYHPVKPGSSFLPLSPMQMHDRYYVN